MEPWQTCRDVSDSSAFKLRGKERISPLRQYASCQQPDERRSNARPCSDKSEGVIASRNAADAPPETGGVTCCCRGDGAYQVFCAVDTNLVES
eukprot:767470-Hanusia_phi.AAC.1